MGHKFSKFLEGLKKTRNNLFSGIFSSPDDINEDFFDDLEEALILADVGYSCTEKLLMRLREKVSDESIKSREEARIALSGIIAELLEVRTVDKTIPSVFLIVGVNGVGKTTSVAKMAYKFKEEGRKPLIAAADTFRAAASDQLTIWADRIGIPIVKHQDGADPGAVVYDAISAFKARNKDLLIIDTAGRLHNKTNLMNELAKIQRIIKKELPDIGCEVFLTIDATTGQNGLSQVKSFSEIIDVSGVILTKLDGTAKGGIAIPVFVEHNIPVRYVGLGEQMDDFQEFDPVEYAESLL